MAQDRHGFAAAAKPASLRALATARRFERKRSALP